jgi:zinc transport system permease protein
MLTNGAIALGIIILTVAAPARFNIFNLLFGDMLTTSYQDIIVMYIGAAIVICGMVCMWRPLLLSTINNDLARVEGVNVSLISFIFTLMVAIMVALSIKIVGVLLVSSLLVIPATIARIVSKTPEKMAVYASGFGVISVFVGVIASLNLDTPTGPSIVIALLVIFIIVSLLSLKKKK